jgi:hypothetical protein
MVSCCLYYELLTLFVRADYRFGQAILVPSRPDGALQTLRRHQGTCSHVFVPICRTHAAIQRARDPEYAALMDAQPQPKKRGRKKAEYVVVGPNRPAAG